MPASVQLPLSWLDSSYEEFLLSGWGSTTSISSVSVLSGQVPGGRFLHLTGLHISSDADIFVYLLIRGSLRRRYQTTPVSRSLDANFGPGWIKVPSLGSIEIQVALLETSPNPVSVFLSLEGFQEVISSV